MFIEEQKWFEWDMFEEVILEDFEKIISVVRSEVYVYGIYFEDFKIYGFLYELYQIKNKVCFGKFCSFFLKIVVMLFIFIWFLCW